MNKNMLKITELRKILSEMPKDEIIKLMVESYKLSKEDQTFLNIKFKGDEEFATFLQACKTKIRNEFLPDKGFGKLRVGTVKKAVITDTKGVGCWEINDSLEGSFSAIKWLEDDEGR